MHFMRDKIALDFKMINVENKNSFYPNTFRVFLVNYHKIITHDKNILVVHVILLFFLRMNEVQELFRFK